MSTTFWASLIHLLTCYLARWNVTATLLILQLYMNVNYSLTLICMEVVYTRWHLLTRPPLFTGTVACWNFQHALYLAS